MAKDCLIKRLKGVADNDALRVMGELRIHVKAGNSVVGEFGLQGLSAGTTISIVNGSNYFTDSTGSTNEGTSKTSSGELDTFWISAGGACDVVIKNDSLDAKYILSSINLSNATAEGRSRIELNASDLKFNNQSFWEITIADTNISGNVEDLLNGKQIRCKLDLSNVVGLSGSLNEFVRNLTYPDRTIYIVAQDIVGLPVSDIEFDISNLAGKYWINYQGKLKSLQGDIKYLGDCRTNTIYTTNTTPNTYLYGSVEEYVQRKLQTFSGAGVLMLGHKAVLTRVTYEGVPLSERADIPASVNGTNLTWDAQGNITFVETPIG